MEGKLTQQIGHGSTIRSNVRIRSVPTLPQHLVQNEIVRTRRHAILGIVAAHGTGRMPFHKRNFILRQIGFKEIVWGNLIIVMTPVSLAGVGRVVFQIGDLLVQVTRMRQTRHQARTYAYVHAHA